MALITSIMLDLAKELYLAVASRIESGCQVLEA